jgi:hypothetical protein
MVIRSRGGTAADPGLTFPLWMRGIITLAVLGGGLVLIFGFSPWWELGRPVFALGATLLAVYAGVGAVLAARMWAPDSFEEPDRILLIDRGAIADVERRQESLIKSDDGEIPTTAQTSL